MYGEAAALSALLAAIGDAAGARRMATEAAQWQRRVLALWNANTSSFDTLHMTYPPKPPAPPPGASAASARAEGVRAGSFLDDEVDAWPTIPGCKPQKRKCRSLPAPQTMPTACILLAFGSASPRPRPTAPLINECGDAKKGGGRAGGLGRDSARLKGPRLKEVTEVALASPCLSTGR